MTNDPNGWAGRPGVPLSPEVSRWHWVNGTPREWVVFDDGGWWRLAGGDCRPHEWAHRIYQGPCLTPAEVDARIAAVHKEWLAELNHDTDALMEQARQSALEEAAQDMDCACPQRAAVLAKLEKDGPLSHHWPCEKSDDCCALRGAAIRALKEKCNEQQ